MAPAVGGFPLLVAGSPVCQEVGQQQGDYDGPRPLILDGNTQACYDLKRDSLKPAAERTAATNSHWWTEAAAGRASERVMLNRL